MPPVLYLALFFPHIIIMLKRNFSIRQSTLRGTHSKQTSNFSTLTRSTHFKITKNKLQAVRIVKNITEAWQMVKAGDMEFSQDTILRYLKKRLEGKAFRYTFVLIETLKNRELPKLQKKIQDFNMPVFQFQIKQMKQQLQNFLTKRYNRDMQILKQNIQLVDKNVKQCIDLQEYQRLVNSFRPNLITNSSDLVKEYQGLGGHSAGNSPSSTRMQQYRYTKLAQLEAQISQLHSHASLEKSDTRLFQYYQVFDSMM